MTIESHTFNAKEDVFQKHLHYHYRSFLKHFKKTICQYIHFNIYCISLLLVEFIAIFFLLYFPTLLAVLLGVIFLTGFTYLVLLFYFQTKKPEQMSIICEEFLTSCRKINGYKVGRTEHHLSIAHATLELVHYLNDFEKTVYQFSSSVKKISPILEKFSAYYYWKDVFKMKEMLLNAAILEHIQQIHFTPTNLEVHISMANSYVSLSKLYLEPKKNPQKKRISKKVFSQLEENFQRAATHAIEEFKILKVYAPNDPWIHLQLAKGYNDLHLPQQEAKEYEYALKIRPEDHEILFRLGVLYFELGQNAKGLKTYEKLKEIHPKMAKDLITFFGCYKEEDFLEEI